MAWVAVDKDGGEYIYENTPQRLDDCWYIPYSNEILQTSISNCIHGRSKSAGGFILSAVKPTGL